MVEPNKSLSDEMISAYLDEEVSSTERELIERTLQQDARSRQLYEDLHAVREAMQTLPRQHLDDGFSARVAQRIRELRSRDASDGEVVRTASARTDGRPSQRGFRRGLVWAALAIGAAVLLMVFQPRDEQQIVSLPEVEEAPDGRNELDEHLEAAPDDASPPADLTDELGRRRKGDDATTRIFESRDRSAVPQDAQDLSFQALLRADVTADQFPEIVAALRNERWTMTEASLSETSRGVGAGSHGVERLDGDAPAAPEAAADGVRGIVVQGAVADVQAALQRAHVVARVAAPTELQRAREDSARLPPSVTGEPETAAERQRPSSLALGGTSDSVPAGEVGSVLVLFNVLPSTPAESVESTSDEPN